MFPTNARTARSRTAQVQKTYPSGDEGDATAPFGEPTLPKRERETRPARNTQHLSIAVHAAPALAPWRGFPRQSSLPRAPPPSKPRNTTSPRPRTGSHIHPEKVQLPCDAHPKPSHQAQRDHQSTSTSLRPADHTKSARGATAPPMQTSPEGCRSHERASC